jgi:hypothetical protein
MIHCMQSYIKESHERQKRLKIHAIQGINVKIIKLYTQERTLRALRPNSSSIRLPPSRGFYAINNLLNLRK